MTLLDSSSLRFWEVFSEIGFVLVIVGVAGEAVELFERLARKKSARIIFARVFWVILVFGLAMEFLGSHNASRIADAENARLHKQAETLSASNLVLQADVLKLQAKQKARVITPTQVKDFIFLTERIPKFPIRVAIGQPRDETLSFASHIRTMLNQAGFNTPDSDTNFLFGVFVNPTVTAVSRLGEDGSWEDADFMTDTPGDPDGFRFQFHSETINGIVRPVIHGSDTNQIYGAIGFSLQKVGITIGWQCAPNLVSPNHCGLYVLPKPQ